MRPSILKGATVLCVAALLAVSLAGCGGSSSRLSSGTELVFQAQSGISSADLETAASIMNQRVKAFGVSKASVSTVEPDQIVVVLAGAHDPEKAAQIIGQAAELDLYDLENDLKSGVSIDSLGNIRPFKSRYALLTAVQGQVGNGASVSQWYLFGPSKNLVSGPTSTKAALFTAAHPKKEQGDQVLGLPPGMTIVTCGGPTEQQTMICPGASGDPTTRSFYLFDKPSELTGKDLKSSGIRQDFDQNNNRSCGFRSTARAIRPSRTLRAGSTSAAGC